MLGQSRRPRSTQRPQSGEPTRKRFYERVVKIKAEVVALLNNSCPKRISLRSGNVFYTCQFHHFAFARRATKSLGDTPGHRPATGLTSSVVSVEFVVDRLRLSSRCGVFFLDGPQNRFQESLILIEGHFII
jgi:hypothetical protein